MKRLAIVLVVVLLAGCSNPAPSPPTASGTSNSSTTPTPVAQPSQFNATFPVDWNGKLPAAACIPNSIEVCQPVGDQFAQASYPYAPATAWNGSVTLTWAAPTLLEEELEIYAGPADKCGDDCYAVFRNSMVRGPSPLTIEFEFPDARQAAISFVVRIPSGLPAPVNGTVTQGVDLHLAGTVTVECSSTCKPG